MLTEARIKSNGKEPIIFKIGDPSNGFILTDIEGLGPVKANIVATQFAMLDGVRYRTSYRGARDIKFTVDLEPRLAGTSAEALRKKLYASMIPQTPVTLEFVRDNSVCYINGVVEDMNTDLFSQYPNVVISVFCDNPNFISSNTNSYTATTNNTGRLDFITYNGSVPTGLMTTVEFKSNVSGLAFYSKTGDFTGPDTSFFMDYNFLAGDFLTINSNYGSKKITLTRPGNPERNLVYTMDTRSEWPKLYPGGNRFWFYQSVPGAVVTMKWNDLYGGL